MNNAGGATPESVAIIGMACRFPGAPDPETFWRNLRDAVESITFFSDFELEAAGVAREMLERPDYVKAGGALEDVFLFDAPFFGIPPRQAEMLDPQHRVVLECAWEALESAGYDPAAYPGAIGVFAGAGASTYLESRMSLEQKLELLEGPLALVDGGSLTARVSYRLDLRGPSIALQTACSTSLVAVHLACQSLLDYHCDMALAGGVSIFLPQPRGYLYREGLSLSPDGRCRPFDRRAVGTVHGNGAGMILLKRFSEAVSDGDPVRAVIRGSAVNNDGAAKLGFTTPCVEGLAEVVTLALGVAGVAAETIGYVETHGIGTPLGDSMEVAALTRAFRLSTEARGFCALGSNKPNVGHLDEASGIASLIKTTLALENRQRPPVLHFESPHPDLLLEDSPFFVNAKLAAWPTGGSPRRAGVSSSGIGGTNAHIVLEEAPPLQAATAVDRWNLMVLSARDEVAREEMTQRLRRHLELHSEVNPSDLAYTLQLGRRAFGHRRAAVYRDVADLRALLADPARLLDGEAGTPHLPCVFLLPGDRTPTVNAGRGLYLAETAFRDRLDDGCRILERHLGCDLRRLLYPAAVEAAEAAQILVQPRFGGPALVALQLALAALWETAGVRPELVVGYGAGQHAAAVLAGGCDLEQALRLAAERAESGPAVDPVCWTRHLGEPVRLSGGLEELRRRRQPAALVELGAGGPAAAALAQSAGPFAVAVATLPGPADPPEDLGFVLAGLGRLWVAGTRVDFAPRHAGKRRRRVPLPTYPFQRERFELQSPPAARSAVDGASVASIVAARLPRRPRPPLPTPYTAPRNEVETEIVAAWQEVLGFAPVGIHDDFLALSGDSLLATQIASRLGQRLHLPINPHRLFEHPSPAELAVHLAAVRGSVADADRLGRLAELVGGLSTEEVKALLEGRQAETADAPGAGGGGSP